MLFFNTKKNLWAGRELATDNSFILLWLHCRLCLILLFVPQRERTLFSILYFQEENFLFSVMCAFLSAMAILTPNYSFVDKDNKKIYPINIDIFTVSFSFEHGD